MDPQSPFSRSPFTRAQPSPLGRLLAWLSGFALLALGLMFSLVLLVIAVAGGALLAGWWWWKTRALRQAINAATTAAHSDETEIIEGEVISKTTDSERLPE